MSSQFIFYSYVFFFQLILKHKIKRLLIEDASHLAALQRVKVLRGRSPRALLYARSPAATENFSGSCILSSPYLYIFSLNSSSLLSPCFTPLTLKLIVTVSLGEVMLHCYVISSAVCMDGSITVSSIGLYLNCKVNMTYIYSSRELNVYVKKIWIAYIKNTLNLAWVQTKWID